MQSLQDIGERPYQRAARRTPPQRAEESSGLEWFKFVLSVVVDVVTFLVLLVPILVGYVVQWFRPVKRKNVAGQVALVTGGSNGLGREICLQLAREGCHIAVADLDASNGESTAADIRKLGVKARCFKVDVASLESVERLRKEIEGSLGAVDILVNNAGVLPLMSIREGTPDDIKRVIEVNLLSHLWTLRTFIDGMISRKRGHIVAVASAASFLPLGRLVAYVASKYGVRGVMEALQDELYLEGMEGCVHTSTVYPLFINTRAEVMNTLEKVGISKRVPVYSARAVARATVNGMLENRQRIFLPQLLGLGMVQYERVPTKIVRLARRILLRTELPKLMD